MHLTRPRHIIASCLVFLLLGGSGMLVGIASASEEATMEGQAFALAASMVGDKGSYTFVKADLDADALQRGFHLERDLEFAFEVLAPELRYASSGDAHWAWGLSLEVFDDSDGERVTRDDRTLWIDGTTVVGSTDRWVDEDEPTTRPWVVPGLLDEEHTGATTWTTIHFESAETVPCGLVTAWQGRDLPPIGQPVDAPAGCDPARSPVEQNQVAVVRGITATGPPLVVVDHFSMHPSDSYEPGETPDWTAWFLPDVPYPVRLVDVRGGQFGAPGDALVLTGFERGKAPMPPAPPLKALPPVEYAPPTGLVIDERGVAHPFPLSEAVAYAKNDAQNDDLRTFLADHPDAFLGMARHAAFDVDGSHTERWEMIFTTGDTHHRLHVAKDTQLSILGPADTYRHTTEDTEHYDGQRFLDPATLDQAPTVASMLARWRMAGAGTAHADASESYGFWLNCQDACDAGDVRYEVGSTYYYRISDTLGIGRSQDTWHTSTLWFRTGSMESLGLSEQDHFRSPQTPVTGEPPATADDDAEALSSITSPGMSWPDPKTSAAIGAGALLGALAYYTSPLLKAGFMGLFSRVRRDEVLEHPQRRRVMEAIEGRPGIHTKALQRATGQENGVTRHHLGKLVEAGKVTVSRQGGYTCYFPAGKIDHHVMQGIAAVKSVGAQAVLRAATLRPGANVSSLAQAAQISPQTAHYHVKRLVDAGLVETVKDGSASKIMPTPAASQALALA